MLECISNGGCLCVGVFSPGEESRFPLLVARARVRSPEFSVAGKVSVRKGRAQ